MRRALLENWPLFLGMLMLMIGNGLLVVLLTIRGASLGFSEFTISIMQGFYPLGALFGTLLTPRLIEKVGHIRVFSALASAVSAAAIVHLLTESATIWTAMRFISGFCFPGLYVISESWLNAKSENRTRAQVLSIYFIIQTLGPAIGTALSGFPDPSGTLLFGITSILLSLAIVPLLLSGVRAPEYVTPERMPIRRLYQITPLTVLGIVVMAICVAAWFISLPLLAIRQGFSEAQASGALVVAMLAAAALQYPLSWLSDHTSRRLVVIGLSVVALVAGLWMTLDTSPAHLVVGFAFISAATLPVYSILAAHANDQLSPAQIVTASGTMAFLLQLGQLAGTLLGPNLIALANGRGLQLLVALSGLAVIIIASVRIFQSESPTEKGTAVATGVIGLTQPGILQAELRAETERQSQSDGQAGANRL